MGKPTTEENTGSSPDTLPVLRGAPLSGVQAVPSGADKAVIRAVPGQPWPEPTAGGTWVRNPRTGDLTCMDPGTQPATDEERRARREQQRDATLKAAATNTKE